MYTHDTCQYYAQQYLLLTSKNTNYHVKYPKCATLNVIMQVVLQFKRVLILMSDNMLTLTSRGTLKSMGI